MSDPVPSLHVFIDPILRILGESDGPLPIGALADRAADRLGLTEDQRAQRIPSGPLTYRHRTGWAKNIVKNAGLVQSPARGTWAITDEGRQYLDAHPEPLTQAEIRAMRSAAREAAQSSEDTGSSPATVILPEDDEITPEEAIERRVGEMREAVKVELLDLLKSCSPMFFEQVVLDVLLAMGYGADRDALQRVGGSGDGGIDGIISLDRLGLEKVYVQAKRWQGSVGRPEIQGFFGAVAGRRANKGVFITTSRYTREAKEFASTASDSLVLVDGPQLAGLMIDYRVGVEHRAIQLPQLDRDYFDEA